MLSVINCTCGESICNDDGRCKRCGKYRMLPMELSEKSNNVDKAIEDLKTAVIEWMNKNQDID